MKQIIYDIRVCSNCNLTIENPFLERCPRCLNQLEKMEKDCSACLHKSNCSLIYLKPKT